jgi:hypothetical protein
MPARPPPCILMPYASRRPLGEIAGYLVAGRSPARTRSDLFEISQERRRPFRADKREIGEFEYRSDRQ